MHAPAAVRSVRPLQDRVLIRPDPAGDTAPNTGIILPDHLKDRPRRGLVLEVGPGRYDDSGRLIPMGIRAGQRVLFAAWGETEVEVGGEKLFLLKQDDLTAVVTD